VVQGHGHPWLQYGALQAADSSWISGTAPPAGALGAKTRYRQTDAPCRLAVEPGGERFGLTFPAAQWAVTPGQSAVLYDGDVCLGGGVIDSATPSGSPASATMR
jgi:tRNA-specific 2-thiouridylase